MPFRQDEFTGWVSAQDHAYAIREEAQSRSDIHRLHFFTMICMVSSLELAALLQPEEKNARREFAHGPVNRHDLLSFRRDLPVGKKTNKRKTNIMGDKSPKATSKQASQKQVKAVSAQQKKQQAIAAKTSAGKKK